VVNRRWAFQAVSPWRTSTCRVDAGAGRTATGEAYGCYNPRMAVPLDAVGELDAYFRTRDVRDDDWSTTFALVYPTP
jgi:hypothetical protein